jgi:hypothetical protein
MGLIARQSFKAGTVTYLAAIVGLFNSTYIYPKIHPSQQIGEPNLLASFIMSLTTANNRFLNGSNISYDGGISNALLDLDY